MVNVFEQFNEVMATRVVGRLGEAGQARLAALYAARSAMPDSDVYDRIRLARYILTGSEGEPAPPDYENVTNMAGETVIRMEKRTQTEDYPFTSGDVLVLGPEIFASTQNGPQRDTLISWAGVNFVPQDPGFFSAVQREQEAMAGVVGPDPEFEAALAAEETPVDTAREPAPSAGTRWAGRRGKQPD